jgi:hypothetical protein
MKNILVAASGLVVMSLFGSGLLGCASHERVVVHDRPEVVRVQAAPPPPPVVQEKVIVRP